MAASVLPRRALARPDNIFPNSFPDPHYMHLQVLYANHDVGPTRARRPQEKKSETRLNSGMGNKSSQISPDDSELSL